ncbi:nucleotide pyrophosphohydrolase [Streptomyces sp. UNOC14_S4]|uniref:nucleotide pyrophosphohydrolase n=1 Tax=Streptomyces sp. UNOC14_S4 TaxID=2872340 RepID=UPI001E531029|nr:nucleotide pyrophosphohydrolase [Streptomyces sp. UNOC14_S4]MCC3772611.1 nucleotide pyrophosphohydrolase [Streptomyces sp. UNOC14_S4]
MGRGTEEAGRPGAPDRLDVLQRRLAGFAAARGWQPFHTPKNLAAALSVEAAELVEIFQWLTPEQSARVMEDPGTAGRVEDEVADVLAYLLQFCEVLGIDAGAALAAKIERNEHRFPVTEHRSGGGSAQVPEESTPDSPNRHSPE